MIKKQRFGIEIEMTGITREKAANILANTLNSSVYEHISSYDARHIKDSEDRTWKIVYDSSIRSENHTGHIILDNFKLYRVELVSPILTYDDIELLQSIVRDLKKSGAKVNESCGIHIHIDGANHCPKSLRRLVNFIIARQDLINEALENKNRTNEWCKKLSPALLSDMKKNKEISKTEIERIWYSESNDGYWEGISHEHYNRTRYHGINLHSYFAKGTVEFRLFNSTLHAGKVKAYIQFCLAISAWAIESDDKISFKSMDYYTAKQKVTIMRSILTNRLGLTGSEFKTCRLHLMAPLKRTAELARDRVA